MGQISLQMIVGRVKDRVPLDSMTLNPRVKPSNLGVIVDMNLHFNGRIRTITQPAFLHFEI